MNSEMSLRIQTARRRLSNHNLSWKEVETDVGNILTATSDSLGIDHNWTFNYHYYALRVEPTIVLKARHRDLPHAVAVKYLHPTGNGGTTAAQSEFATLSDLHRKLGPEHCSIVTKPFAATRQGYACEWVHLPSMKTILLTGAFSANRRHKCIETAAAKLRLIHNAVNVGSGPLDTDVQVRRLRNAGGYSQAWLSAIETFAAISQKLNGQTVPHGPVHADFTPGNILLGSQRCVIFDFGRHHDNGPTYSDMMYFLVYVIAYCTFGSSKALHNRIDQDIDTFMSAYGDHGTDDRTLMQYFYLAHLLNRWGRHEAKSQKTGRHFHLRAYDRFSAQRVAQLSANVMRRWF